MPRSQESQQRGESDIDPQRMVVAEQGSVSGSQVDRADRPPADESEGDEDDLEAEEEISYVLIRRAASIDNFERLDDPYSLESRLARGRGRGHVVPEADPESGDGTDGEAEGRHPARSDNHTRPRMEFEEGKLQIETGFAMRFVPESMTRMPVYDVVNNPDLASYPVSQRTLDSIPDWAYAKLHREGHLKCSGVYNPETHEFDTFRPGWQQRPERTADALAEILQELDGDHLARSVYYYLHQYASEHYSHPESIAALRGIKPSSVVDEIRQAERELDGPLLSPNCENRD